MNKSIYLLSILGVFIAGCSQGSNSNSSISSNFESSAPNSSVESVTSTTSNFESGSPVSSTVSNTSVASSSSEDSPSNQFNGFSNLKIDLSSIKQIGIYKNSQTSVNGRKYNQNTNQNSSYLIGYNENGDALPLIYLNSQDEVVQNPYSVFSFEVVGDFSYIVYYNPVISYNLETLNFYLNSASFHGTNLSRGLGDIKFKSLIIANDSFEENEVFYIILHNPSGKLFNAVETLGLLPGMPNSGLLLFTPFEEKINYFVRRNNTCGGELSFDWETNSLLKTEVCTTLYITPIFVHSNGYFVYSFNNAVSYASPDFAITGNLTQYFNIIPERNMVFKTVNNTVVMVTNLFPSNFVVFDSLFQVIEERSEELERGFYLSEVLWLFNKNGFDYFDSNSIIHYVNFETFEYGIIDFNEQFPPLQQFVSVFKYFVFDGNLYQIASKIQILSDDKTFVTLDDNVFEVSYEINLIMETGYLEYSKTSGLSQINKYLNLQTGEIFLESETRPTITVTQVQPLN